MHCEIDIMKSVVACGVLSHSEHATLVESTLPQMLVQDCSLFSNPRVAKPFKHLEAGVCKCARVSI
jgi:hypothetical protein